jgi:2-haloacid dehalogenase
LPGLTIVEQVTERDTIDAVVLDIGGVIMDWDPRHLFERVIDDQAEREWFLTDVCGPDWNRRQDEGRTWAEGVAEAIAAYPDLESWIRSFDERWIETIRGLFPETVAIVRELSAAPVDLYALTNFSAEKWVEARAAFDVLEEFDGVVVSGEERLTKPDPAIFDLLLRRFDLDSARTFFTDDVQANVDAARAVGLDAELFTAAGDLRDHLVERGVLRP